MFKEVIIQKVIEYLIVLIMYKVSLWKHEENKSLFAWGSSPRVYFSLIFLSSIYTLPSGTPQPICPPSSAIHFSLLNYSSNVEVFICSSVSQCVCVSVLSYNIIMVGNSSFQPGMERRICTGGGKTKKQMNEAEIARKMGRNKEKCWEVTPRERPFFWTLGPL